MTPTMDENPDLMLSSVRCTREVGTLRHCAVANPGRHDASVMPITAIVHGGPDRGPLAARMTLRTVMTGCWAAPMLGWKSGRPIATHARKRSRLQGQASGEVLLMARGTVLPCTR